MWADIYAPDGRFLRVAPPWLQFEEKEGARFITLIPPIEFGQVRMSAELSPSTTSIRQIRLEVGRYQGGGKKYRIVDNESLRVFEETGENLTWWWS